MTVQGDLQYLSLFHYGGNHFRLPFFAFVDLTPGKRFDASVFPTGHFFIYIRQ